MQQEVLRLIRLLGGSELKVIVGTDGREAVAPRISGHHRRVCSGGAEDRVRRSDQFTSLATYRGSARAAVIRNGRSRTVSVLGTAISIDGFSTSASHFRRTGESRWSAQGALFVVSFREGEPPAESVCNID